MFKRLWQNAVSALRTAQVLVKRALSEREYLMRPENKRALGHLWQEIKRLIRAVFPKKGGGEIRVGLSDPYETGRLMEIFALLYPFYGDRLSVTPEFETQIMEAKQLRLSGRIYLITVLRAVISIVSDRNLRKLYRHFTEGDERNTENPHNGASDSARREAKENEDE